MKMKLIAALVAASTLATTSANAQTVNGNDVKVSTKGGFKVESGPYKFQLGGRIQYDYNNSELNGVTDEDEFDIRRARIFAKGSVSENWHFKAQFNLDGDGGDDNVEDLYIRYTGFGKAANVTIGNQKQPFALEEQTSSKDISILERSSITELFSIGREEGVQLHGKLGGNQTYGVGVFFADTDSEDAGEELGFAARYTIAPIKTDTSVLHLGVGYRFSDFEDLDEDGDFGIDDAFNIEAAYAAGPFHIQAEYFDGDAIVGTGFGDVEVDVDGFYVQAGYILTGETRPYSGGKFKRVNPGSKLGAWELVARYEDGNGNFGDVELGTLLGGAEADSYTLGVNWYAHKNVRLGVNFTDGDDNFGNDGQEFRVRFQLTY